MEYKQQQSSRRSRVRGRKSNRRPAAPRIAERRANPLGGSNSNPIISVRNLPLFGLRTRKRLMYFAKVSFTGSSLAVAAHVFSANGAYDPDQTGTGLQPIGFDQMMAFFNHYTVLASRIRCTFQNTSAVMVHAALSVSGTTTVTTDDAQLIANGQVVYSVITPSLVNGSVVTLNTSANSARFQGITDAMDDPDMRGDAATNPVEQLYYHLSIWNPVNATVPSVLMEVCIEYDTVFHEPRKAALS